MSNYPNYGQGQGYNQYNPYSQYGGQQSQGQNFNMPQSGGNYIPSPTNAPAPSSQNVPGMLPMEESYIENILRLNKGKVATVYATFENNKEWNAKVFKGIIEAAGRDHLILTDPQTGMRYLIPMIYLDYITFDEEIEYEYPYAQGYTPRR